MKPFRATDPPENISHIRDSDSDVEDLGGALEMMTDPTGTGIADAQAPGAGHLSTRPSTSPKAYQYEPLEPGSLRILLLLEADDFADDLECAILNVSLDASYTALSYVWGDARGTHKIYAGDKYIPIGQSLDSALRHLRRRDHPIQLWVDALCIDQFNIEERNHQVHLMRHIYQSSEETIVFLGDLVGNTGLSAWTFLERNSSWALNEEKNKDYSRPAQMEDVVHFRGQLHDVYHDVLSREWFRRVWVLQEVVVSKEISIQCGPHRVPWDDFCRLVMLQDQKHDNYGLSLHHQDVSRVLHRMWHARVAFQLKIGQESYLPRWYRQVSAPGSATTDILEMLVRARNLMASDPRDKIFALLGISAGLDWESLGTIDYANTTVSVYTKFASDLMAARGDYRVLSYLNRASTVDWLVKVEDGWARGHEHYDRKETESNIVMNQELLRTSLGISLSNKVWGKRIRQAANDHSLAAVMVEECLSQLEDKRNRNLGYDNVQKLHLPSWVPNWQCIHSNYEPRAIVETSQETRESLIKVDDYRTWLSHNLLAVHGCVIGFVDKVMSSCSILSKDELLFEELKQTWEQNSDYQQHSLDAQLLTLWGHLLDATAWTSQDFFLRKDEGVSNTNMSPELFRRGGIDVHQVLRQPPGGGSPEPGTMRKSSSFLNFLDLKTCPPIKGSIEAHLIARSRQTAKWSDDTRPVFKIISDPESIVDKRLVGVYDPMEPRKNQKHTGLAAADYDPGHGYKSPSPQLALLPSSAMFGDMIVYFPGASIPFLVRPTRTCPIMESSVEAELTSGRLPFLECTELYTECELLGECWINGYKEIVENRELDFVFGIS